MPKEMISIVDTSTIQYIVEEVVPSDIEVIIIVTGKGKCAIEDHFDFAIELEQNLVLKGKLDILERVQYLFKSGRYPLYPSKSTKWSRSCGMVCT